VGRMLASWHCIPASRVPSGTAMRHDSFCLRCYGDGMKEKLDHATITLERAYAVPAERVSQFADHALPRFSVGAKCPSAAEDDDPPDGPKEPDKQPGPRKMEYPRQRCAGLRRG
jgi:hypothetical protein